MRAERDMSNLPVLVIESGMSDRLFPLPATELRSSNHSRVTKPASLRIVIIGKETPTPDKRADFIALSHKMLTYLPKSCYKLT